MRKEQVSSGQQDMEQASRQCTHRVPGGHRADVERVLRAAAAHPSPAAE
jgi:hypothetical protein